MHLRIVFALEVVILCHCVWVDSVGGGGEQGVRNSPILILIDLFAL